MEIEEVGRDFQKIPQDRFYDDVIVEGFLGIDWRIMAKEV
jgi:hypothetical protein